MKIRILSSALDDLYKTREFYEQQGEGLGDYFIDTLFSDIDSLALYGGIHQKTYGFYRMLSKRFPYGIYYKTINDSTALVYRVLDLRSDPQKTKKNLE